MDIGKVLFSGLPKATFGIGRVIPRLFMRLSMMSWMLMEIRGKIWPTSARPPFGVEPEIHQLMDGALTRIWSIRME